MMIDSTTDEATEAFIHILLTATRRIKQQFFIVPRYDDHPVYRERVYCYELYHQIRCLMPKFAPYDLMGELSKSGQRFFRNTDAANKMPDLLVHKAGTDTNLVIVEVKRVDGEFGWIDEAGHAEGVAKDLQNLTFFTKPLHNGGHVGYKKAIFLAFGEGADIDSKVRKKANEWAKSNSNMINLDYIKVYWHKKAGEEAQFYDW